MVRKLVLASLSLFCLALFSLSVWERGWSSRLFQELPLIGDPAAPVEVVLFEDPLCPHCRTLQREIFPLIRDEYIATKKVKVRLALVSYVTGSKPFCLAYYCLAKNNPELLNPYLEHLYTNIPTEVSAITDGFQLPNFDLCMQAAARSLDDLASKSERLLGENDVVPSAFVNGKRVGMPVTAYLKEAIEKAL